VILVASIDDDGEPDTFLMSRTSDPCFNLVHARVAALDVGEARELFVDAWRTVVPMKLAGAYDAAFPNGPGVG